MIPFFIQNTQPVTAPSYVSSIQQLLPTLKQCCYSEVTIKY